MNTYNFVTVNAEIVELSKLIVAVSDKDSSVSITFGARKSADDKLEAIVKVLSSKSTLMFRIHTNVPDTYEGEKVSIAAKASVFNGILEALLPYKADVTASIEDGRLFIGVSGKARFECPILSELPTEVTPSNPIIQFALDSSAQKKLIRAGLSCTSASDDKGLQNACLRINARTAEIIGFSTDSYFSEITSVKGSLPDIGNDERRKAIAAKMQDELKAYCEKTGQNPDKVVINIPHDEVARLKALTQGAAKIGYVIDANHVSVMINNAVAYTFTQGANPTYDMELATKKIEAMESESLQIDNEALARAVDVHNKVERITGIPGQYPVLFSVDNDELIIKSGAEGVNATSVAISKKTGTCNGAINGAVLTRALSLADKGNLVMKVIPSAMVVLYPGTLDNFDHTSFVSVMQVNTAANSADEEAQEAAESEEVTQE